MDLGPHRKTVSKATIAVLLIVNVAVAVFVIHTFGTYLNGKSSVVNHPKEWMLNLDKTYVNNGRNENERPQEHDIAERKLSPVHFPGLDFDVERDKRKISMAIRNWVNSEGSERTLCYNDMTYKNGSMTVPEAGVYHITSHVKFYVEHNRKNDKSSQTFHHQIVRYSASSREQVVLFENVVTECREGINDGAHLEYPSLTGGLAQLDAGDHVIVRVSHFDLLKHDRDWHYFDMYLV